MELDVALLTKRVAKRNVDDCKKLKRCISYLNQTVDDVRIKVFFKSHILVHIG